jgi:hypothetical protein
MRVVVVYKRESDYGREVEEYLQDFTRQTTHELEVMDPDTREGSAFCRTYDVVEYPTIIALSDNGSLQNLWRGKPLPTISEVSYYV